MTKKIADFKIPVVRRAIRLAHAEQLIVDCLDVKADGTVHLEFRDYELTSDGSVRGVADEAA